MRLKEKDIAYENGKFWVLKNKDGFHVMISGITHSVSDSSYRQLDLAIARCDYLARRAMRNQNLKRFGWFSYGSGFWIPVEDVPAFKEAYKAAKKAVK